MTMETGRNLTPDNRKWLLNIWHSKQLESELGNCLDCGREGIEFKVWLLADGTIKKYKECPDCLSKYEEEQRREEEVVRLAEVARIKRKMRESSGIPPKFMHEDFSSFKQGWQDKAFKKCWDYAEGFPVAKRPEGYLSLYLWSSESWGVGKTHLSAAICHRILDRWSGIKTCPQIIFLSEPELFRRIQATYSFTNEEKKVRESEDDIIKSILCADLVVLDDVGKEPRRDMQFVRKILFAVINGRYNNHLPIIITANLHPDGLKEHLDEPPTEASFNRVWEMIKGESVKMNGKSYRRKET